MSDITTTIAEFATSSRFSDLPESIRRDVSLRVLDTFGCALDALSSETARVARAGVFALGPGTTDGATVIGSVERLDADRAAFANGVAATCFDFNDVYVSRLGSGVHPSCVITPLIALAETRRASGLLTIEAIAVAYEVLCRLCDSVDLRPRGWDGVTLITPAVTAGAGALLQLDAERVRQSLNIACVDAACLYKTRVGALSMWKGGAAPQAARKGLLAAVLAAEGMTGPDAIFAGEDGFAAVVSGDLAWPDDDDWRLPSVGLKAYPAVGLAQSAIEAAITLHRRIERAAIDRIVVRTFARAIAAVADTEAKWNPHTRETADHSLPYVVAVSLVDGAVTSRQFSDDRLADPALQALTKSVEVVEDPDFTAAYPAAMPAHVEVHLANGTVESCTVEAPLGHGTRPMDEQAVHAKFVACGAQHRDSEQLEQMAAALLSLEAAPDVTEPMSTLAFAV